MKTNNEVWQEFIYDFFLANYQNIEYLTAKREFVDNELHTVYNILIFPVDLNKSINIHTLQNIVDTIFADESLKNKIFGSMVSDEDDVVIAQNLNDKAWYIKWNEISQREYSEDTDEELNDLFNYKVFRK